MGVWAFSEDAADPDALAIAIRALDAAPTDGGANLALRAIAAVGNLESFADPVALDIHAKPEADFSALIKPESCGIHDDLHARAWAMLQAKASPPEETLTLPKGD